MKEYTSSKWIITNVFVVHRPLTRELYQTVSLPYYRSTTAKMKSDILHDDNYIYHHCHHIAIIAIIIIIVIISPSSSSSSSDVRCCMMPPECGPCYAMVCYAILWTMMLEHIRADLKSGEKQNGQSRGQVESHVMSAPTQLFLHMYTGCFFNWYPP